MLVTGGRGPDAVRATLTFAPAPADRIWCAVKDVDEQMAAAGLARIVRLDPWPGVAAALARLARRLDEADPGTPVVLLASGWRLARGHLRRAARALRRRGCGVIVATPTRRAAVALRARLRVQPDASIVPGAGLTLTHGTLTLLAELGWLDGTPLSIRRLRLLCGRLRLAPRGIRATPAPARRPATTLTVVVPAHNERAWVGHTLRSIAAQSRAPEEVIVVDDGSTDGTGDVARALGARVIRPARRRGSKGPALNVALGQVRTDVVVVIDADTILGPDTLAELEKELARGYDAVSGAVLPLNERGLWSRGRAVEYGVAMALHKRVQLHYNALLVLSGCIAGYRTEALRAVGGFSDRTVGEDMDMTWTLHLSGFRVGYTRRAIAYTVEPSTWRLYKAQMRRWAAAFFQSVSVHKRRLRRRPALLFIVGACLWDVATVPIALLVTPTLIATGVVEPGPLLAVFAGGFALAACAFAATTIGLRRTIRSIPGFLVISVTNAYFFVEALVREWVLRRRSAVWVKGH